MLRRNVCGILVEGIFEVGFGDWCRCSSVYSNSLISFQIHHHRRHLSNWYTEDRLLLMRDQDLACMPGVQIRRFDLLLMSELCNVDCIHSLFQVGSRFESIKLSCKFDAFIRIGLLSTTLATNYRVCQYPRSRWAWAEKIVLCCQM
jgi:hypothetical protein